MPRRTPYPCRAVFFVVFLLTPWTLDGPSAQSQPADDEAFLTSLSTSKGKPVDRRGLARLFFSAASTLEGGARALEYLPERVPVHNPSRDSLLEGAHSRYGAYVEFVGAFRSSSAGLIDAPDSALLLYRTLADGHRACWKLDQYRQLLETYGLPGQDLLTLIPSTEACDRFRRAAFLPKVEQLVADALVNQSYRERELRELRSEMAELERLLEDLRRIDDSD